VQIVSGAEVAWTYQTVSALRQGKALTLGKTDYVLVELWRDVSLQEARSAVRSLIGAGYCPVLAHVERYNGADQFPKYREQLLAGGVLFQCNAAAFLSFFGSRRYLNLLADGEVHFLGSDCHNTSTRSPKLDQAAKAIEKKLGEEILQELNTFALSQLV
jgi:protein-tyrosine phosphatase